MKIHRFFAFGVLLTTLLLCAHAAYAQDVTVSKPTKPTAQKNDAKPSASKPTTGTINGHEWVDLGLSVKWATCNIGASSPSDYGDYFAWGETKTKSRYTKENSTTLGKKMGSIAGDPHYDAARANWGGTWRLPTMDEMGELVNKCKHEWTTQGGHRGYKVTGPNGNSIFLPAAGWRPDRASLSDAAGWYGYYWSATPYDDHAYYAYNLGFYSSRFYNRRWDLHYSGRSVRPVTE